MRVGLRLAAISAMALLAGCAAASPGTAGVAGGNGARDGGPLDVSTNGYGAYIAGEIALRRNDLDAASGYFEQALAFDPENVDLMRATVQVLLPAGRIKEAATVARRMQTYGAPSTIASLVVAEQAAKAGDWPGVAAAMKGVPTASPLGQLLSPMVTAWALEGQGQTDAALAALGGLDGVTGAATIHDYNAALIDDLADRREAAGKLYSKLALGEQAQALRIVEAAVAFYRRTGDEQKVAQIVDQFHKTRPGLPLIDDGGAPRLVASASDGLAEAIFVALSALQEQRDQDPDQMLDLGRLALDLRPDFPLAQATMGDILQQLGRLDEADAVFGAVKPDSALSWSAQLRVAENLGAMGQSDKAVQLLRVMMAAHPDRPEAALELGEEYRAQQRWQDAIAAYDKAIAALGVPSAGDWRVYFDRGMCYDRLNQWPQAEADLEKAVALSPTQPEALNYLGYSWLIHGDNLSDARRMIEQAVARSPTSGYIVDSLGWLLYRTGQYDQAVTALRRAIALEPSDPDINEHLGDALWADGRQDEARFQWRAALVFADSDERKAELHKKIDDGFTTPPPLRSTTSASAASSATK